MSAFIVLALYAACGVGFSLYILGSGRDIAGLPRSASIAAALLLWPFLLPTVLAPAPTKSAQSQQQQQQQSAAPRARSARGTRIFSLASDVRARFVQAGEAQKSIDIIDAFAARLARTEERLVALDVARESARPSAQDKLSALRSQAELEIEKGERLLEELAAQLVVLEFQDLASAKAEHDEVATLLARIEALAELNAPPAAPAHAATASPSPSPSSASAAPL